jgi:hypothetical protein
MRALHLIGIPALAALASFGACKKAEQSVDATEADCVAYRNKLFSLLPADEQAGLTASKLDKPTPKEIELCRERMNADEIACAVEAATIDEALACKSATDDRPAHVKRTAEECKAFSEHITKLAEDSRGEQAFGPPLSPTMVKLTIRECDRWLSKQRYDCVMKQPSTAGILGCPP